MEGGPLSANFLEPGTEIEKIKRGTFKKCLAKLRMKSFQNEPADILNVIKFL